MRRVFLSLAVAVTCAALSPTLMHADSAGEFVYVESNLSAPHANSIYGFSRGVAGHLMPLPGSPFLTGGAGVKYIGAGLGPFDSDQEVITNKDQTLLFAVNAGSDSIAVFHIAKTGALSPVEGSPFPSGGNDPVSLAIDGSILFVANQSGDLARPTTILPNYTTMRIQQDGTLIPLDGHNQSSENSTSRSHQQTVSVAVGSSPSQAYVVPRANLLFGADFLGGLLEQFRYDEQGKLHIQAPIALPADEFPATAPRLPLGLWSHPRQPILYVGYVTVNKVAVYRYADNGELTFLRTVPNDGKGICWLRTNKSGSRLYTTDTASNQISVYDTTDAEYPVEIQTYTLSGRGQAFQLSLSEDGEHIYALSQRSDPSLPVGVGNVLHSLVIKTDGTVDETASPVALNEPNGARPQGIAVVGSK